MTNLYPFFVRAQSVANAVARYLSRKGLVTEVRSKPTHVSCYIEGVFENLAARARAGSVDASNPLAPLPDEDLRLLLASVQAGRDDEPFATAYESVATLPRDAVRGALAEQQDRFVPYLARFLRHRDPWHGAT